MLRHSHTHIGWLQLRIFFFQVFERNLACRFFFFGTIFDDLVSLSTPAGRLNLELGG